jgi:hypothetical protein
MSKIINQLEKNKYFEYLLLSIILVLGVLVRLYKINNPVADWHSWRQADTASVTRSFLKKGIDFLFPSYQDISSIQTGIFNPKGLRMVEFPIYNAINALLVQHIPKISLEAWGRLVSIAAAIFSSVFLFFIGKRFMGKWGGILASFFFLFLPYNIYFTRVILPEPLATTLALAGVWLFIQFIDKEKPFWLYLSGVCLAASLLIKPFTFFYGIPLIYLSVQKYGWEGILKNAKNLIRFLIFVDIVLVPLFLWRAWINKFPEGIPFFIWAFNGDRIRFRPAFWRWIFAERIGSLFLGVLGLIPFSLGILSTKKKDLFNLWFFLGGIFYVTLVATANVRHDYYQIFLVPPVSLLLAQGSLFLWKNRYFNPWISRSMAIFSILIMFMVGAYQVKEFYKINHPEIIAAGRAVDRLTPKDALVIAPYNGDTAFLYQTNRWGWPAIDDSIDRIILKGADYYVSVNKGDADTQMISGRFKIIEETPEYLIADLHQPIKK